MKFLIFFAVAAFIGSVHCDKECFRAIFKECVREPVSLEKMTLCDEIEFQVTCVWRKAHRCGMPFWREALDLYGGVAATCTLKKLDLATFEKDAACYVKSLNDSECVGPMNEVMKGLKTQADTIRANKKICNLFDTYTTCAEGLIGKNCNDEFSRAMFNQIYEPYVKVSNSICKHLILPADEEDNRLDNFGVLNVFASLVEIFASA